MMVPAVTSGGRFALAMVSAVSDTSWLASVDALQLLAGVLVQPLIQSYWACVHVVDGLFMWLVPGPLGVVRIRWGDLPPRLVWMGRRL